MECYIGGALLTVAAWVRYAGTARSLSVGGAYTLILIAQVRTLARFPPSPHATH